MAKRYARIKYQDCPSVTTPLNASNLNKMDKGIDDLDNAIDDLYSAKFAKADIIQSDAVGGTDKVASAEVTKKLRTDVNAMLKCGGFYEEYTVAANSVRSDITITAANLGIPAGSTVLAFWCAVRDSNPLLYNANCGAWNVNTMTGALFVANNSASSKNVPVSIYALYK